MPYLFNITLTVFGSNWGDVTTTIGTQRCIICSECRRIETLGM